MMRRQRGVALLVVLLMLALMAALAAVMAERSGRSLLRAEGQLGRQQAKWYALGAESLAGNILLRDALDSPQRTHLAQFWAQQGRQFPVDGGEIQGRIRDGRACLNLNAINQSADNNGTALTTPYPAQVLQYLLINLGEEDVRAQQVTGAVRDWIDADGYPAANGAEDASYASLSPPYRPANQPMSDISELRTVYGVDADLYQRLLPYVCVLPQETLAININTLSEEQAPLLAALLLNQLDSGQAAALLSLRPRTGWESLDELWRTDLLRDIDNATARQFLTVKSDVFFVDLHVRVGDSDIHQHSLLRLNDRKITVLQRKYGWDRAEEP
ncbi:type II secretion system minor pseudopilin GspK [Gibbsiella quercinecans]|nr:type II secretion system minor pseudopilin GspK [Gibbsiella quercinecans]RLM02371.1 type II secretion protein K [Gibbsiella quercinecans]